MPSTLEAEQFSLLDEEAPRGVRFAPLSTEEAAALLGVTTPAMIRKFQRGKYRFAMEDGAYRTCREWLRQGMEADAVEQRKKLGIDEPGDEAGDPKSLNRDRAIGAARKSPFAQ